MSDLEKLYNLIVDAENEFYKNNHCAEDSKRIESVVEHLIANGVTVKEWVSVSESPKENGIYCVMVENHKNRKVKMRAYARYRNGRWLDLYDNWENRCWHVTYWMPLPELPKEEEHKNADAEAANGRRSI